jgi:GPH family glycoside/pentoside/hexuronide:cation symporter
MAIISQLLWNKVVVRVGTRSTAIIGIGLFTVFLIPLAFVKTLGVGIAFFALLGVGLGALLLVEDMMVADICDEDYLKTGARREGMYYGVNALIMRSSVAISAGIIAFVQIRTHYVAKLTDPTLQPHTAVVGFRALMSGIPAVLMLIALVFILMYPLYGKKLEAVKKQCALTTASCPDPGAPSTGTPAI